MSEREQAEPTTAMGGAHPEPLPEPDVVADPEVQTAVGDAGDLPVDDPATE